MFGAIIGDIIGSVYEFHPIKTTQFPLFSAYSRYTDDTVLTIAVADCLLNHENYVPTLKKYFHRYPNSGFGGYFMKWACSDDDSPYHSYGNGSAMRVSPVGFAFNSREEVLAEAKKSASVTHDHSEGIKGAQATPLAIYLARTGKNKEEIRNEIQTTFDYDLNRKLDEVRSTYHFDETCQGSVPQAIIAFLESESFEDAIRNAISLGGDADTQACIAGGIAEAFYKEISQTIKDQARERLPEEFLQIIDLFYQQFIK